MPRGSSSVALGAANAGLPPTVAAGVQMALNRGGRGAVPVVTSVVAIVVAVFTITASLTFGAGLTHLLDTPRLVGLNWDLMLFPPMTRDADGDTVPVESSRVEAALAEHPGVESFAAGTLFSPFPNTRQLQLGSQRLAVYMYSFAGTGEVGPSLIRGRAPAAPDEILVGPETLDDLGLALGDTVDVYGQAGTWEEPGEETSMRVRIVGVASSQ